MNSHHPLLLETKEGNLPLALRHLNGPHTCAAVSAVLSERFGVDDSAVSQGARGLARLRLESAKLDRILLRIEKDPISKI